MHECLCLLEDHCYLQLPAQQLKALLWQHSECCKSMLPSCTLLKVPSETYTSACAGQRSATHAAYTYFLNCCEYIAPRSFMRWGSFAADSGSNLSRLAKSPAEYELIRLNYVASKSTALLRAQDMHAKHNCMLQQDGFPTAASEVDRADQHVPV